MTQRVALLLAIPLVSLVVQWAVPTVVTWTQALQRFDYSTVYDKVAVPAQSVTDAIQEERLAALVAAGSRTSGSERQFQERMAKTDEAVAAFRRSAFSSDSKDAMDDAVLHRVEQLDAIYGGLPALRNEVRGDGGTRLFAVNRYSSLVDITMRVLTTLVSVDEVTVYQHTNGVLYNYWAREFMLREHALMSGLRVARMTPEERAAFGSWAGSREQMLDLGRATAGDDVNTIMSGLQGSIPYSSYTTLEGAILWNGIAPNPRRWKATLDAVIPAWQRAAQQSSERVDTNEVKPAGQKILIGFYLVGGIGLIGLVASIVLSLVFARRLTEELRALQRTAQVLAHERLPRVVARLRRGERVDVEAEAPPPETGRTLEVALVSEAFHAVQRTAVSTAVGESDLRASINRVFINLSWRSQSLLHRQLRLLDAMERRARSPEELDDLFRLDHLTTRMRRHAEGLVILSGSPTVRAWDHPVAAEDVVRAAIAEVEDYRRIEVTGASSAAVTGNVVADVIHLLAELIENAAAFSPPSTEVTVKVETVANGLAVEVVDRGVGLHPEELAELNRRLASDVEFDLVDTERLGLFVVARLAARHRIRVQLQPSAYGGTTAIVLVPHALVVLDEDWRPALGEVAMPEPAVTATALRPGGMVTSPLPALPGPPSYTPPAEPPAAPAAPMPPMAPMAPTAPSAPPAPGSDPLGRFAGHTRPSPEDPPASNGASSEITGRLPRRIRQRNLAPQLRKRPDRAQPEEQPDDFDEPSPELSRDLMSSLQSGWLRGRDTDDETGESGARDEWGES
ncbi:sensor histidine kinase [Actinomadura graeca]|uniref:histidine kinase n=1 Tax=Actinomadura graeca TaxID=2750812 RepID=A0ABX8QTX8_9ACTN|nr:sensor histidine kinase [Actinomadura graeca]QXJ20243.1 sensor histidine kinase [Actinomadura graeca]